MITPNKVVSIEKSALGLVGAILKKGPDPIKLEKLYHSVGKKFESLDQFILAIDLLYVIESVDVSEQTRELYYVD